ncbi:hypothetical protein ACBR37_29615, partial [Streptomyces sp. AD55]
MRSSTRSPAAGPRRTAALRRSGRRRRPHRAAAPKAVAPEPGDTPPTRRKYSAFVRADPAAPLGGTGRDRLLVGVHAHTGVPTAPAGSWMRDARACAVADAVADFSRADHGMAPRRAAGPLRGGDHHRRADRGGLPRTARSPAPARAVGGPATDGT